MELYDMPNATNITNQTYPYGHSLSEEFAVTIAIYFIFLVVAAVIFNGALIMIIITNRILHNSPNVFIANLALCDLFVGVSTLPFDADFLLRGAFGYGTFVCGLKETLFMFSLPSGIVNLMLLTTERFVLIVYPYKHYRLFNKRNNKFILLIAWSYMLLFALFPIIYDPRKAIVVENGTCHVSFPFHYVLSQVFVNFFLPLICILVMNILIYKVASKHSTAIKRRNSSFVPQGRGRKSILNTVNMMPANFKAAKNVMCLVGVFLFCWLTFITLVTWNIICYICHPRAVTWTGNAINYSVIVLNPLIYGLLNKDLRKIIWRKYKICNHARVKRGEHEKLTVCFSDLSNRPSPKLSPCISFQSQY